MVAICILLFGLHRSTATNVEIIEEFPPVIRVINDSYVFVDYQNSITIEDISMILSIDLLENDRTGKGLSVASKENMAKIGIDSILKIKTKLRPCKKYENLTLIFESIGNESIIYRFNYDPSSIIKEHINDWICAEDDDHVTVSKKESTIDQVKHCLKDLKQVNDETSFTLLGDGNGIKVWKMKNFKIDLLYFVDLKVNYLKDIQLKLCEENKSSITNLFYEALDDEASAEFITEMKYRNGFDLSRPVNSEENTDFINGNNIHINNQSSIKKFVIAGVSIVCLIGLAFAITFSYIVVKKKTKSKQETMEIPQFELNSE